MRSAPVTAASLLLALVLTGCGSVSPPSEPPTSVAIVAAADLRFALGEVIATYGEEHPATDIVVSYGSSGTAYAQLANGAPFDVFFSADIEYPRLLEAAGLAVTGATRAYAVGRIVVWARSDSPLDVEALGLDALADPAVRRIAIANPEHAPYGRAAVAALRSAGLHDRVAGRFVLGENVSQALQFVESGAADVGVIAYSLALAPTVAGVGRFGLVPAGLHPPIEQGVVVLDRATDPAAANGFVDHILGPDGRAVLERYGFAVPGG